MDLFKKLREITGVLASDEVIGANTAVPVPFDIVIKDGENGGVALKRLHCDDARFSVAGYSPRPEQNVTMSLSWESDGGNFVGVTAVESGAVPATSFTVDSGRQISAVVPAGAGAVDVTVTNAKGVSSVTPAGEFTSTV